jgi:nitronate monooxygenase
MILLPIFALVQHWLPCMLSSIKMLDRRTKFISYSLLHYRHGIRRDLGSGTLSLTNRLVRLSKKRKRRVPVLAAGGIVDGRGLVAALSLGADGAVLGTRLWASQEALGSSAYKIALTTAGSCDDVVRTRVFDTICNSHRQTKWPYPFDSSGTLRNDTTDAWDTSIPELDAELKRTSSSKLSSSSSSSNADKKNLVEKLNHAEKEHLPNVGCVYSGQGVGEIISVDPAYDIIQGIEEEAIESLSNLRKITAL